MQREKLDSDFQELMKSAPQGLRDEYAASVKSETDQGEITEVGAVDEELIVLDYHSDDGKENGGSESEDEVEEEHVTKVSSHISQNLFIWLLSKLFIDFSVSSFNFWDVKIVFKVEYLISLPAC